MPKYGDDQCEECGGIRVANSILCASCLVKERDILEKEVLIKMMVIKTRGMRITRLEGLLEESTAYGFKQNQENARLQYHVRKLEELTTRRPQDEKNG